MSAESPTTASGRRNWRRRWKRSPAERRLEAAASLGDVFRRRRLGGLTPLFLLLSLAAHVPAALFLKTGREGMDIETAGQAESYLRQVIQKERATSVSRDLSRRITMPPPPPEPEAVVNTTLAEALVTDIERVIGDTLEVQVTGKLTQEVTASLREELAAAAKQIADGTLSAREIADLQDEFKRKAHRGTVRALKRHREKTQVQHAKLSVKEWYDTHVSRVLVRRMTSVLFGGNGGLWAHGWNKHGHWAFLQSGAFTAKLGQLGRLIQARHYDPHNRIGGRPTGGHDRLLPDWPKPTTRQGRGLAAVLTYIDDGWDQAVAGYIDSFYPHRRQEMTRQLAAKTPALWERIWKQVEAFRTAAATGADEKASLAAREACFAAVKELHALAARLAAPQAERAAYHAVNQAIRSRVLRGPTLPKVYKRFVDNLVEALAPAMRDIAANEFGEGILIREKGIDRLMKALADEMIELLRKDVRKMIPLAKFRDMVFEGHYCNPYRSAVTGEQAPPSPEDIRRDEAALAKYVAGFSAREKAYVPKRTEVIAREFAENVDRITDTLLGQLLEDGRLRRDLYTAVESVDYTDKAAQRLHARARALAGRGQDIAALTDDGVPDTSASMVALLFGAGGGRGAGLQPVLADMTPGYVPGGRLAAAMRAGSPRLPPPPASWARVTQSAVRPPFDAICAEGIPFLANFPRLDGDLRDWGRIRPLVTQKIAGRYGPDQVILVYAAWNYQGFFFGYHVTQPAHQYAWPGLRSRDHLLWRYYHETTGVIPRQAPTYRWAYTGDYLRLLFDTVDARSEWRGEPYTQEFLILPRGTEMHPNIPGIERYIRSMRDCQRRAGGWGMVRAINTIFPPQPMADQGPDGTGPFRVTRLEKDGYTVELFLPRTLFNVPVLSPGWWIGFECVVAIGRQTRPPHARIWGNPSWNPYEEMGGKDHPNTWGDLLLLGTDPYMTVQEADQTGSLARAVVPGHSYLLTVVDPDRNIHLTAEDTVVVSAEVSGSAAGAPAGPGDVEVFLLTETGKNTSVFRGYVDTQPGRGREVQGVIEGMPGQEVRFGYVDLANARGDRNVIYHLKLPVVAGISNVLAKR